MAVDNLLAASPLTITRQIVEQTGDRLDKVREQIDKLLLEGGDKTDQSASRPQSQPVGSAQPSAEDGGLGQGTSDAGGNTTSSRGNIVNTEV
ncbi:MAG: hypothetical protein ACE5GT_14495 [Rhodospirillales bacterium]